MQRVFYSNRGKPVELGSQLGAGGEGAVFDIKGHKDYVAKRYHNAIPPEKAKKLSVMVDERYSQWKSFSAWPVATLHESAGSHPVGIIMPRAPSGAKEIHELTGIGSRLKYFPKANWAFLLRVALN